jgi:hypothetical protein
MESSAPPLPPSPPPQRQEPRGLGRRAAARAFGLPLSLALALVLHTAQAFVQQQQPPPRFASPRSRTTSILPFGTGASSYAWPPADSSSPSSTTRLYAAAPPQSGGKGKGGGLGALLTAVPRFLGGKLLDAQDSMYVKRALFLPPANGSLPAADADAVVVVFPGIGMGPKAYGGVARAVQETLEVNYDIKAYVVVAKFFNNLGYLPKEPERRLNSILAALGEQGVSPRAPLGVVGHSGGAFLAYDAALTRSQAFVHLGSTLNSKGALLLGWVGWNGLDGGMDGMGWVAWRGRALVWCVRAGSSSIRRANDTLDTQIQTPNTTTTTTTPHRRPPLDAAERGGVPEAHSAAAGGDGRLHPLHGRGARVWGGGEAGGEEGF